MAAKLYIECCSALVALTVDDAHVPVDTDGKPTGPAESLHYGECPSCGHHYYNVLASHAPGTEFPPNSLTRPAASVPRQHKLVEFRIVVGMPKRPVSNEEADAMLASARASMEGVSQEFVLGGWHPRVPGRLPWDPPDQPDQGWSLTIETVDD